MSTDLVPPPPASPPQGLPPIGELLSLGYVYLLVLGIVNRSLFYGLLGVNYLAWSDVLDVLISPVALLMDHPGRLAVIVLLIALLYPYTRWIQVLARKRRPPSAEGAPEPAEAPLVRAWLAYSAVVLVGGFVGFGAGAGMDVRERLATGEAEPDHRIEFRDGRSVEVELVGKNTGFLFYFAPGDRVLSVVPVADNVHRVQRLAPQAEAAGPSAQSSKPSTNTGTSSR